MPISPIVVQRRHAELGRIRLGQKGDRGQPQKLQSFRFTSPSRSYIDDLATLYGGEARAWDNGGKPEFEVFTTATSIPVIAVKGGLSQWMETWSGGGCTHRCDGERDVEGNYCDPDDPKHKNAKPTTRLSVMLPELEALGVWRMESHGWNAAAEIPAVAELAQYVGDLVPANLHLVERRAIKDGKTSRFVVPVLDLQIGAARLRELAEAMSSGRELAPSAATPEIEGPGADRYAAYFHRVRDAGSLDDLRGLWAEMVQAHLVGTTATPSPRASEFVEEFNARAAVLQDRQGGGGPSGGGQVGEEAAPGTPSPSTAASSPPLTQPADRGPAAGPDADGAYEAELVDEPDADTVWDQIVKVAGQLGDSLPQVQDDIRTVLGVTADVASGAELQAYLDDNLMPRLQKAAS